MTRLKTKLLLAVFVIALILLSLESVTSQRELPPEWEETYKIFDTEQDLAEFVGDECLLFKSEGLHVDRDSLWIRVENNEFDNPEKWEKLYQYYYFDDQSEVAVHIYFEELDETPGFPLVGAEVQFIDIEGVLVKRQVFERQSNASRMLFVDGGKTYEVTISTTESSPDVESYLRRIIPDEEKDIGPTDFADAVIGSGNTTTEIITTEQK